MDWSEQQQLYIETLFNVNEEWTTFASSVRDTAATPIADFPQSTRTQWISLNPLKPGRRRNIENTLQFRNFLIEIDDESLSIQDQMNKMRFLEVPYSTAVFSGGKSVHFVIALDKCVGYETWKMFARWIGNIVTECDQSCLTACVYTRLAGATREKNGKTQELLEVNERISRTDLVTWLNNFQQAKPKKTEIVEAGGMRSNTGKGLGIRYTTRLLLKNGYDGSNRNEHEQIKLALIDMRNCGWSAEQAVSVIMKREDLINGLRDGDDELFRLVEWAWSCIKSLA